MNRHCIDYVDKDKAEMHKTEFDADTIIDALERWIEYVRQERHTNIFIASIRSFEKSILIPSTEIVYK